MVQGPFIFYMCTTDVSLFRVFYSKHLNSDFNALCHLPAGMAFVEIKASSKYCQAKLIQAKVLTGWRRLRLDLC